VGPAGVTLAPDGGSRWRCPETGELFTESEGALKSMANPTTKRGQQNTERA
jgi:hypothetical protein